MFTHVVNDFYKRVSYDLAIYVKYYFSVLTDNLVSVILLINTLITLLNKLLRK